MVKNLPTVERLGFNPWVWKVPWRREWQATPVFLPEKPMDRGVWWAKEHEVPKN